VLILHWNGIAWRQVPAPSFPGGGSLNGVTASSPADAWAIGQVGKISGPQPDTLILHWNGIAWSRLPGMSGTLLGVAASASGSAWAVGVGAPAKNSITPSIALCTARK